MLPDLIQKNLTIIFCGSAVGHRSNKKGVYYAGIGNVFWKTLNAVGLTPRQLEPEEYKSLLKYDIGLTDLAKNISGNDDALTKKDFDREHLNKLIHEFHPKIIAFTGKRAAKEFLGQQKIQYGQQNLDINKTLLFVLPSPSGAARKYWDQSYWEELSDLSKKFNPHPSAQIQRN